MSSNFQICSFCHLTVTCDVLARRDIENVYMILLVVGYWFERTFVLSNFLMSSFCHLTVTCHVISQAGYRN